MKINSFSQSFIGCSDDYDNSSVVIFGAGFDGTTSYRAGARFASSSIRNESYSIETFSPYQNKDLSEFVVFDAGELELPFGNTNKVLNTIEYFVEKIISDKKVPLMIGGEHLVTLGAIRAFKKNFDNLFIVHFDAHADLRDEYLGESLSHATVMRRCYDIVGDFKICQFGIRSGTKEEFEFATKHLYINKFDFDNIQNLSKIVQDNPVYFTIDLDVLDPSYFPGTGTPDFGGVSFCDLLQACMKVCSLNIVGLDITELSPPNDPSNCSTSLACKLLREILICICQNNKK